MADKLDWVQVRDLVQKDNVRLNSIQKTDVDWFLRDENVLAPPTGEVSRTSKAASKLNSSSLNEEKAVSILSGSSKTPETSGNPSNNVKAKTQPLLPTIQTDSITRRSSAPIARRRSSACSTNSEKGEKGMFHKLMLKLKPSLPDPKTPNSLWKQNYSVGQARTSDQELSRTNSYNDPKTSEPHSEQRKNPSSNDTLEDYVRMYSFREKRRSSLMSRGSVPESPPPSRKASDSHFKRNFLRRKSVGTVFEHESQLRESQSTLSSSQSEEPAPPSRLKWVAFHSLTFLIDPPQQIPSRTPRKGNVDILPGGVLRINPLTDAEKEAIEKSQRGLGGGLVVGGTGALGLIKKDADDSAVPKEEDYDEHEDEPSEEIKLEEPVTRKDYTAPVTKMALDVLYVRCCHLREILPIPAILKQIPAGLLSPLPLIQLRNSMPTMIEILTFADFIRIAPILCISLDGVCLSLEQFKIVLSAMCAKTQLEKLSLRNTPINKEGWLLLCWFLLRNKVINRLDITQCPPLLVNVLKRKKKDKDEIVRMTCNMENRSDMDWALFTAALISRGGIEELILTGCCLPSQVEFSELIKRAISLKTYKLGLAYNKLSPEKLRVLLEHWVFTPLSRGLDLGYNDFLAPAYLQMFLEVRKKPDFTKLARQSKLGFLSMNATNIPFDDLFKDVFEHVWLQQPNLKYLDLSNNKKLFGEGQTQEATVGYFTSKLPLFNNLVRLHLENNGLLSAAMVAICEIIPFCKRLGFLSLIGNPMNLTAAAALVQGVKNSPTLITVECDYDQMPEVFKERIGLYTMRNMERIMSDEKVPVERTLTEQLTAILAQKAEKDLDLQLPEVQDFKQRAINDRRKLKLAINELLNLQFKGQLGLEGKEALIRFLFIDSSLERGLKLIDASFVEDSDHVTSTDMLAMHLAENNNRLRPTDRLAPSDVDFLTVSSVPVSRQQLLTNLTNLNKEEGSMLRLLRFGEERENRLFDQYTGEEIREKLTEVNLLDLDKVIAYLLSLQRQGVSLKLVFDGIREGNEDILEDLKEKLKALLLTLLKDLEKTSPEDLDRDPKTDSETPEVSVKDKPEESASTLESLNNAYDQLLSERTQRHDI